MANVHFFTDPSKLKVQDPADTYGAVDGFLNTKFRTTQKGFLSADSPAFAICSGSVFLQPYYTDTSGTIDTTLVNLVLVPTKKLELNNGFTNVQFIIYRGLKKAHFLDSSNNDGLFPASSSVSPVINKIWQDYAKIKLDFPGSYVPTPSNRSLGWQFSTSPGADLFQTVLETQDPLFQITSVPGGTQLGEFKSGKEGVDIVLEDHLYSPDLNNIRAAENVFTVASPSGSEVQGRQAINKMREREVILNYIDPIAWLMLFEADGINYFNSQKAVGVAQIHTALTQKFETSNTLYLDLRNETGHSLNYFKDNEGNSQDSDYGMHLQYSWDGVNFSPAIYHVEFWPSMTNLSPPNSTASHHTLYLKFRKLYNPVPVIYADFVMQQTGSNLEQLNGEETFLRESTLANPLDTWSEVFQFDIPNISGQGIPTWVIKANVVRTEQPSAGLPGTVIARETPYDLIFGPIDNISSGFSSSKTTEKVFPGKRFLVHKNYIVAGNSSIIRSGNDLTFAFRKIDTWKNSQLLFENKISNSLPTIKIGIPGESNYSSRVDYLKPLLDENTKDSRVRVRKDSITVSSISIPTIFIEKDSQNRVTTPDYIELSLTWNEFQSQVLQAISTLSTSYHDPILQIDLFTKKQDDNGLYYKDGVLSIASLDTNGLYQKNQLVFGNFYIYTREEKTFTSEAFAGAQDLPTSYDPKSIFNFSELIQYVTSAEALYMDKVTDTTIEFTTRLRAQYYGQLQFIALIPYFPHYVFNTVSDDENRVLDEQFMHSTTEGEEAFKHLTAEADENLKKDNTGPYLIDTNSSRELDFGHTLFGLQALQMPFDYASNTNNTLYQINPVLIAGSKIFKNYNLDPIDFAGWIADIGIAVGMNEKHKSNDNQPPLDGEGASVIHLPESPDIDRYYEISAPEADLEGDIDSYGLLRAWNIVESTNPDFRLSDVLTYYYQNPSSVINFYHYRNRYLIFCEDAGISHEISTNNWSWPDPSGSTTKSIANYANLLNKVEWMASFWFDQYDFYSTVKNGLISNTQNYGYADCEYVLNKFLQWLKPRVEAEQPNLTFTV